MVFMRVQKTVVVAQHRKDDGQSEIGVVHAALLAALAVHGQFFGVERHTRSHGSHTLRWPGMIQKNTLALMAVAIMAPTNKNAARPATSDTPTMTQKR